MFPFGKKKKTPPLEEPVDIAPETLFLNDLKQLLHPEMLPNKRQDLARLEKLRAFALQHNKRLLALCFADLPPDVVETRFLEEAQTENKTLQRSMLQLMTQQLRDLYQVQGYYARCRLAQSVLDTLHTHEKSLSLLVDYDGTPFTEKALLYATRGFARHWGHLFTCGLLWHKPLKFQPTQAEKPAGTTEVYMPPHPM